MDEATRKIRCERWQQAVRRTLGWAQPAN